jgi:hypothetical protein
MGIYLEQVPGTVPYYIVVLDNLHRLNVIHVRVRKDFFRIRMAYQVLDPTLNKAT